MLAAAPQPPVSTGRKASDDAISSELSDSSEDSKTPEIPQEVKTPELSEPSCTPEPLEQPTHQENRELEEIALPQSETNLELVPTNEPEQLLENNCTAEKSFTTEAYSEDEKPEITSSTNPDQLFKADQFPDYHIQTQAKHPDVQSSAGQTESAQSDDQTMKDEKCTMENNIKQAEEHQVEIEEIGKTVSVVEDVITTIADLSISNYEEFSEREIEEAKGAVEEGPITATSTIVHNTTISPTMQTQLRRTTELVAMPVKSPIQDVLKLLQKEAVKYRNIQETCNEALLELSTNTKELLTVRSYCFLPLKLAYDTRLPRFCILAVMGFQHLLSDPGLKATSSNPNKTPLAVKIIDLILKHPGTADDLYQEIFKLFLAVACTDSREVHGDNIIKMCELCVEQSIKHKDLAHKTLAHSTFVQILSQIANPLPKEGVLGESLEVDDYLSLLRWLVAKVPIRSSGMRQAVSELYLKHYLEGLVNLLASSPSTLVQHTQFTDVIWQKLCPALIQLLGNPMVDKAASRGKVLTSQSHTIKDLLHIHTMNADITNSCTKSCHSIATQLVRLVGHQAFLRPVLASLFHRIIMFPPPHLRRYALEGVKEVFKDPMLLADLCVVEENDVARIDFALLKMLIDGAAQSSLCGDSTMLGMSASVVVALLDSIQQLQESKGVTNKHLERISGALDNMDAQIQPDDVSQEDLVSEPEDLFTASNLGSVQSFFTAESETESMSSPGASEIDQIVKDDIEEEDVTEDVLDVSVIITDDLPPEPEEIPQDTPSVTPNDDEERQSARNFIKCLLQSLPHFLSVSDPNTLDLSIQQFASDICGRVRSDVGQLPLLNADSVYVSTYMSLDLTRRLCQSGFYSCGSTTPPILPVSEAQFVEWVQGSGGLIMVSTIWLQEVYRSVLEMDLLGLSNHNFDTPTTLLGLLEKFSQVQLPIQPTLPLSPCQRFARCLLAGTWEQVLQVLQNPIEAPHKLKARLSEVWAGSKSLTTRTDLICCCLDGLRRAATLSCKLGMQSKCTTVISHLANVSCSSVKRLSIHKEPPSAGESSVLRVAHVLSMDALLSVGLDVGQFEPKCWKHIFKCCAYISLLEHTKFSNPGTDNETMSPPGSLRELMLSEEVSEGGVAELLQQETLQDNSNTPRGLFSGTYSGVLAADVSTKAVAMLASASDRLFNSAVAHLSTEPLRSFLEALVKASQTQLFGKPLEHTLSPKSTKAMSKALPPVATSVLHLHRLTELVLLCSRSSHSLLNMMQVWSIVANHFTEAACHADRSISKLAITSYHQILTEVMRKRVELAHFSFNESLLKPMEDMLSLGLCDMDTQEQIVSCLCELTEANAREMKSGWKALFRSLRSVKVPVNTEEDTWTTPVFDVVSVVLERDDVNIFADAIIDCVLCLEKFICSGAVQQSSDVVFKDPRLEAHNARLAVQLGLPSLKYLSRIATMLSIMYSLECIPFFAGSDSIKVPSVGLDGKEGGRALFDFLPYNDESGLLKVWWVMIEGMCGTVLECHQQVQAQTMETVYSMLRALAIIPGPQFQILVMCHQLFPMLTSWVKRSSRLKWMHTENMESNFKHACGLAVELVSETITSLKNEKHKYEFDTEVAISSLLQHVMVMLIACVQQPLEGVARVGCSCIRHLLFSTGLQLGDHLNVVCRGLADACNASLEAVHLVLIPFTQPTRLDGGENGLVRVYARKDTPSAVATRLNTLTQQVFLNEKQVDLLAKQSAPIEDKAEQYMRSYVIAWPADRLSSKPSRVPFSDLVIGLLAHSLLIQTVNDLFVGDKHPTKSTVEVSSLLKILTPQTMSVLLDSVWDSYEVCIAFNHRPGLRYLIQKVGCLNNFTPGLVKQAQKSYITYINTILYLRINVKRQKISSGKSYSHAGLSLESIDVSWEGILDTCLKEASCQLCAAYAVMYSTQGQSSILRHKPAPTKKGKKSDQEKETIQEKFEVNDIEHWTSTVLSMLNMYLHLEDDLFSMLLPAIYPATIELVTNVTDEKVRCTVKTLLERVGEMKGVL